MNHWQEHTVQFAPAEGLTPNETEVRVLDEDKDDDEHEKLVSQRASTLRSDSTEDQLRARQQLSAEVRKDPGYKFLMMVSAFPTFSTTAYSFCE